MLDEAGNLSRLFAGFFDKDHTRERISHLPINFGVHDWLAYEGKSTVSDIQTLCKFLFGDSGNTSLTLDLRPVKVERVIHDLQMSLNRYKTGLELPSGDLFVPYPARP